MNSSTLTEHLPLTVTSELQMQRERAQIQHQRDIFATMQSTINVVTDEMRPKQEDESIFLTPKSSPYSPNGAEYDIPVGFHELSELEGGHPASLQAPVPTSPYMCGSPEETYMNNPYGGSPPYSPPYDNSPLSMSGSCSSPGSCSSIHQYGSTDLCSPTPSVDQFPPQFLPPQPSIPSTSCNSMPFSTCCDQAPKNAPCINTIAYAHQPQAWMFYDIPTVIEPTQEVPIEAPIVIHDRQPSIAFYPPSPQPGAMTSMYHETGNMFEPPYPQMLPTFVPPSTRDTKPPGQPGQRQRKPRPPKPPIQVDDSDIKDIPSSAQLWEFTLRVLKKPKYNNMVCWENQKEGLFRFHDAQAFAALWGKHRNRPNMTYDKVARALRYYYKRNIFKQVGGRLTYRFSDRLCKLYQSEE